ncbi:extracellular solute-binding protein [Aureimonas sp. SK2]|uniref:extracellular solute-binding protein n=1 Tax=Aureimonas sp. SK2 TaxID=3015992 RepID=UPI0024449016|nr:extracellular solute-binding protein [Aureimonas sp. SK2]
MDIDRRQAKYLVGGGLVALGAGRTAQAQEAREMVIVTYPGALSGPHRWLADQIEARHPGLAIRLVPSDSQDIVAQIKAAQGYSPYDAGPNDEPPHLIGMSEGYLAKRDDAALPNLANAYPELLAKSGGYGVPATYSLVGIAYNTDLVKTPPVSWAGLPPSGGPDQI